MWLLESESIEINWKLLALRAGYIKIDRDVGRLPPKRLYRGR